MYWLDGVVLGIVNNYWLLVSSILDIKGIRKLVKIW